MRSQRRRSEGGGTEIKLGRQMGIDSVKKERFNSMQRNTEETQEDQSQKPREYNQIRAGLRFSGQKKGHRMEGQRDRRAEEEKINTFFKKG